MDDDPMAAEMTAAIVEDVEHETLIAENGIEALEIYSKNSDIELVISDMNMPLLSGIELFNELKAQGSKAPFILLTGDDPVQALSQEPAMNASLLKDFSLQETLIETIAKVMG